MKLSKKLASIGLAVAMVASIGATSVFASDNDMYSDISLCSDGSDNDWFMFIDSNERIANNQKFTFSFSNGLSTNYFKVPNGTINLSINATSTKTNETFYISVVGPSDKVFESFTVKADGSDKAVEISGLDTSTSYYLKFWNNWYDAGTTTVSGSGTITGIQT